jgi:4-amino-4-deoxy-L-arabinose transferase-like glycosyltransferase
MKLHPNLFSDRTGWVGPLAVSFLLKLFLFFQDAVINSDGVLYLKAAQMIAEGHFHQSLLLYPMPAYPLLIALVHSVLPDWILSAKLISLCAAAAVTMPVYWLTAAIFDRKTAFYAAMAVAVLPGLNDIAPDVIRDPCFHLLACWSVYWMVKASLTERIRGVFWAFFLGGGALLFRIEAVFLFIAFLLYLTGLTIFDIERRQFAVKSIVFFFIPALGGMIVLLHVGSTAEGMDRIDQINAFGRHILSGSFFERYQHIYGQLKESERLSPLPSGEIFKLARHYMPLIYIIGLLESFLKCLSIPYVVLLWVARRCFLTVKGLPLVVLAILTHALLVLIYFLHIDYLSSRYLLLSALLVMPVVGQGMVMIEGKCVHSRWRKSSLAIVVVIFLIFPVSRSIARGMGEDRVIAQTGRWLSDQSEVRQAEWAINDLRYYIYAGKPFNYLEERNDAAEIGRMLVQKNYGELENQARKTGKGIIIIRTSKKMSGTKPDFKHFHRMKQFESHRSIVTIYADPLVLHSLTERSEGASD